MLRYHTAFNIYFKTISSKSIYTFLLFSFVDSSGIGNNLAPTGLGPVGAVNSQSLGLMSTQMAQGVVSGGAAGIPGLAGIGMGIQERNYSTLGTGVGVGGVGQNFNLGTTAPTGIGNQTLLPGGIGGMPTAAAGLGNSGFGSSTPLTGGIGGTSLSLGTNSVGGSAGLGYGDYDRSYDRGDDGYRNSRSSDTIVVRNVSTFKINFILGAYFFHVLFMKMHNLSVDHFGNWMLTVCSLTLSTSLDWTVFLLTIMWPQGPNYYYGLIGLKLELKKQYFTQVTQYCKIMLLYYFTILCNYVLDFELYGIIICGSRGLSRLINVHSYNWKFYDIWCRLKVVDEHKG